MKLFRGACRAFARDFPLVNDTAHSDLSRLRPPPVHHHFDQENEASKLDEGDIPRNTTSNPVLYWLGYLSISLEDPLEV
jgi:hypothetical protein